MKKSKIFVDIIFILIIMLFATSVVVKPFQNDTFFTIALGERVLEYGIEQEEKLVWHKGLEYTNSRWLFDIAIAKINQLYGFNGIYIFVIFIAILQALLYYYIILKITKKKLLSVVYTIFIVYLSKSQFAARAQVISYLLFLLEFYAIESLLKTNKKRYYAYLIIIPILLVNIHASVFPMYFVFYLPYIAEFILSKLKLKDDLDSKILIEKKRITSLVFLMLIGVLLGFCAPKGMSPYTDMFKAMEGISAQFIEELLPIDIIKGWILVCFIITSIAIISFSKTKVRITDCFFILGFALMAFATYRCIYFFYLISTICSIRIINDCLNTYEIDFGIINNKYKMLLFTIFCILVIISSIFKISESINLDYLDSSKYPVDASEYILNSVDVSNMRIYNHFNFGSYLELKGIPAFIDSRSGVYTDEFNPGTNILVDWLNLTNGACHYDSIFSKYQITHVLLYKDELINLYICKDDNYKILYEDDVFVFYERVTEY